MYSANTFKSNSTATTLSYDPDNAVHPAFLFFARRITPKPDGSFIHLIGIRRLDTFLHEHAFYFIQCVRGIAQMGDAMAVGAKNGKVLHSRLGGVLNFGQWQ
jgi:hypothetical protein